MPEERTSRVLNARRTLTLTTALAAMTSGGAGLAIAKDMTVVDADTAQIILAEAEGEGARMSGEGEGEGEGAKASGEGEGEGEGGAGLADSDQKLQRDLSFMEGHLRAGLALCEAGDLEAAKTHMGHPIEEKYEAVAEPLSRLGHDALRGQIGSIAAAAEAEAPFEEVRTAYETARATMEEVRSDMSARDQVLGLAALVRVAGDEYAIGTEGGKVANLHEYQDSWGFLRVVETEAVQMAESADATVAAAGKEVLEHLAATDAAFGDLQGGGEMEMDSSILYGAAARIELTALELPET